MFIRLSTRMQLGGFELDDGFFTLSFIPGIVEARPHGVPLTQIWAGGADERPKRHRPERVLAIAKGLVDDGADRGSEPSEDGHDSDGSAQMPVHPRRRLMTTLITGGAGEVLALLLGNAGADADNSSAGSSLGVSGYESVPSDQVGDDTDSVGDSEEGSDSDVPPPLASCRSAAAASAERPRVARRPQDALDVHVDNLDSAACHQAQRFDGKFCAVCRQPGHGKRISTRSAHEGTKEAQGRPLGCLAAWLLTERATKKEHFECVPTFAARAKARQDLEHNPDAAFFCYKGAETQRRRRAGARIVTLSPRP